MEIRFGWEVFLFGLFYPLLVGWILTLLRRSEQSLIKVAQSQYVEKRFTQRLGQVNSWDELQAALPELLQNVAPFAAIVIFVHDQDHNQFETAVEWVRPYEKFPDIPAFLTIDSQSMPLPTELHPLDRKQYPELPPTSQYQGYGLPIGLANTTSALILLFVKPPDRLEAEQIRVLNNAISALALAISTFHPLAAQPVWHAATAAERKRMAWQLHDTIAQHLNLLRMKLQELKGEKVMAEITAVREELTQMNNIADLAYKQIQSTLQSLQAPTDLVASIREQAISIGELAEVEVAFTAVGETVPLAPYISHNVLSITRELLLNVGKHAQARHLSVAVNWTHELLEIIVVDDGVGFEIDSVPLEGHYGLIIIQERAQEINGRLHIVAAPSQGTTVHLYLPLS
ncbi:MAG: hypothetical protein IPM53_15300 [Anaerolineaceae bacterium]|nr:hypothetical protein [Anaerolineaceae bacterium]